MSEKNTRLSDIYIPISRGEGDDSILIPSSAVDNAYFYPVSSKESEMISDYEEVRALYDVIVEEINRIKEINSGKRNDLSFIVEYEGAELMCRLHISHNLLTGKQINIRIQPGKPPLLEQLTLPFGFYDLFMHPSLESGGLVLMVAPTGSGKSTSLIAAVLSRLNFYGGQGNTIEDPVEFNAMHNYGKWGKGRIVQQEVSTFSGDNFAEHVRHTKRMMPASGGSLVMIGEIRDGETAFAALDLASCGFLVIGSIHGGDEAAGLDQFINYAVSEMESIDLVCGMMNACLRLSIFQKLKKINDEGGDAEWGSHAPEISVYHNLDIHNDGKSRANFDPKMGVKKSIQDITDVQKQIYIAANKVFSMTVKELLKRGSVREVLSVVGSYIESNSISMKVPSISVLEKCFMAVKNNEIGEKDRICLGRPKAELQNIYTHPSFLELRKVVVNNMLDAVYKN